MKIVHIITRLIIGGAQENTVLSCRGLAAKGHQVWLLSGTETGPEGSLCPQARDSGATLIEVPILRRAVRPIADFKACRELVHHLRAIRPDVVHTHSSKAGILGRAAAARAGVRVVVHTIHGMSFNRTQSKPTQWFYRALERWAARHTTQFVAVADAMSDQAVAAGIASREKMLTIRSGLEVNRFKPDPQTRRSLRTQWGVADDEVVVATVARLFHNKGYDEIIAAMPEVLTKCPRVRFVWIGDGPLRQQYVARLTQQGIRERVILTGLVPPEEVARLLTACDILVHASRWEGLPRAVVQALLTELAVVCFDNDGAPEVVRTDQTGILVPLGDVFGLSSAILRLAGDPQLRRRLGQEGRILSLRQFDARDMTDQLEQMYVRLLTQS